QRGTQLIHRPSTRSSDGRHFAEGGQGRLRDIRFLKQPPVAEVRCLYTQRLPRSPYLRRQIFATKERRRVRQGREPGDQQFLLALHVLDMVGRALDEQPPIVELIGTYAALLTY